MRKQLGSLLMAILAFGWVVLWVEGVGMTPELSGSEWKFWGAFETKRACDKERETRLSHMENLAQGDVRAERVWPKGNVMRFSEGKETQGTLSLYCVPDHIDPRQ